MSVGDQNHKVEQNEEHREDNFFIKKLSFYKEVIQKPTDQIKG